MKPGRTAIFSVAMAMLLLLPGCGGMRIVDSDVTAFSTWPSSPPLPGTPYVFERLPSQQANDPQQARLEIDARTSLAKVGMVFDAASPRFSVQVSLAVQYFQRFPEYGFGMPGPGPLWRPGGPFGFGGPVYFGEPYYQREVKILMRDLSTQRVVFETRAVQDGPWSDTSTIVPAMLDSALLGFPQPLPGTRRVNVEIPATPNR